MILILCFRKKPACLHTSIFCGYRNTLSLASSGNFYIIRPLRALWGRGHKRKWGEGGIGTLRYQGWQVPSVREIISFFIFSYSVVIAKFVPFHVISFLTKLFISIPQCCKNYLLRQDIKSPTKHCNKEWSYFKNRSTYNPCLSGLKER